MPKLGCFRKVEVKALREKVDNVASTNLKFTRSKISFSFVSIIDTLKFFHSWQGFSKGNRSDESFPFFRPFKTEINNQWVFHAESPLSFKLILFVFCVIETQYSFCVSKDPLLDWNSSVVVSGNDYWVNYNNRPDSWLVTWYKLCWLLPVALIAFQQAFFCTKNQNQTNGFKRSLHLTASRTNKPVAVVVSPTDWTRFPDRF